MPKTNNHSSLGVMTTPLSISSLQETFSGRVIVPGDTEYDQARSTFYGGIDHKPAAIIRASDAADVSRVVLLARETGMDLSIRGGGHSVTGFGVADGGIMLDLSNMKALQIDLDRKTAWAEAGLTAGEYTVAANAHGLATGFGDTGTVGIGGLTLGGGIGYLARKYGLTIDQLLAAEIVTADGKLLHVDAQTHPDLFWAIRGGGGNFGVVTRFQFELHDVDTILGGILVLPAAPDTITEFIALAESAPDELSTIVNVMTAPPMPFLPPEVHGQVILMAMVAYAGDLTEGEKILAPFRSLTQPLADLVRPMHYPELFPAEEGFHPIAASRTMFIDGIDRAKAEGVIDRIRRSTAFLAAVQLRVLGGFMARISTDATAYAHRKVRMMANVAALYQNPQEKETHEEWASNLAAVLKQGGDSAYVNFLGSDGAERIRAAYPGSTWDRLTEIKARYDPTNLFHLNQNIPPASSK